MNRKAKGIIAGVVGVGLLGGLLYLGNYEARKHLSYQSTTDKAISRNYDLQNENNNLKSGYDSLSKRVSELSTYSHIAGMILDTNKNADSIVGVYAHDSLNALGMKNSTYALYERAKKVAKNYLPKKQGLTDAEKKAAKLAKEKAAKDKAALDAKKSAEDAKAKATALQAKDENEDPKADMKNLMDQMKKDREAEKAAKKHN